MGHQQAKPDYEGQLTKSFDAFLKSKQQEYFRKAKDGSLPPGDSFFNDMVQRFTSTIKGNFKTKAPVPTVLVQQQAKTVTTKHSNKQVEKNPKRPAHSTSQNGNSPLSQTKGQQGKPVMTLTKDAGPAT